MKKIILTILLCLIGTSVNAQEEIDEGQLGAWYMYFFNKKFGDSQFGIQGDYQFRYWNAGSDLEQILLRTGFTYTPKDSNVLFTLGYANITTGDFGDSDATFSENRIYQEALIPQKIGSWLFLTHRFRYEQRFVDDQDFRTRYRYSLFLNVAINKTELEKGTVYAALYNEIFINGQTDIGDNRSVQYFDRNRTYLGMGYGLANNLRMQLGWMNQTTANWGKGQAQISLHHNF
ncbi:DUF2490 domain-containing protein [uncultured Roseivirga sp.]|uniref:DUF2490 domain-containing protein n=1 Tax=uncultured Roseivirga sp. TaxID=543088 RepID=UPI000D7B9305|nr:DUF2490 domain-containing protein [uncultured Roseivirga sp.]PWL32286.1 MAG: DUF2490 domain-containing protein [Roseivirga sp. XM-24bin3]